jgi:hypothetical protein
MTLHHTCGVVVLVTREEAAARGEAGTTHPRVSGPTNVQVRCGKEPVSWRKEGLFEDFEANPDSFSTVVGVCDEHDPGYPTHCNGVGTVMTRDEVIVWEVLTS